MLESPKTGKAHPEAGCEGPVKDCNGPKNDEMALIMVGMGLIRPW